MSNHKTTHIATLWLRLWCVAIVAIMVVALTQGASAKPCCVGEDARSPAEPVDVSGAPHELVSPAEGPSHRPGNEDGQSSIPCDDACSCCVLVAPDGRNLVDVERAESRRVDPELFILSSPAHDGPFRPPRLS